MSDADKFFCGTYFIIFFEKQMILLRLKYLISPLTYFKSSISSLYFETDQFGPLTYAS